MKYLLDTNIIAYLADRDSIYNQAVVNHFTQLQDDDIVAISILTLYELHYSIANASEISTAVTALKQQLCESLEIIPLSQTGAKIFGELKVRYRKIQVHKKLLALDTIDLMLASTAIEANAVLVSNDNIFEKLKYLHPELIVENWTTI
jgi:predicted nucleic acid-binding protein